MVTTIQLDKETKGRLKNRKQGGESFEDVVIRLLEETEEDEESVREQLEELEQRVAALEASGDVVQEESQDVQDDREMSSGFGKDGVITSDPSTDQEDVVDAAIEAVDELEPPGWDEDLQEPRRNAVREALEIIDAKDGATRGELWKVVYDPATGYDDHESLWDNWVQGALHDLAEEGYLKTPGPEDEWRFDR